MTALPSAARLPALLAACALAVLPLTATAQDSTPPEAQTSDPAPAASEEAAAPPTNAEEYTAEVIRQITGTRIAREPLIAAGLEGEFRSTVSFTIGADGRLAGSQVAESSGSPFYDSAALGVLRAAEPFPAFTADMGSEDRKYSITIATELSAPQPGEVPVQAPSEAPASAPAEAAASPAPAAE